jgi:transcriptional regulator with XRE-family HTH domain
MAKADIRKPDTAAYYAAIGGCIEEVRRVSGLTLKEFAAEIGKDERQVKRQIEGGDRPQLEAVFAIERFRGPLVIALAKLAADVDVVTEIRVRRSA